MSLDFPNLLHCSRRWPVRSNGSAPTHPHPLIRQSLTTQPKMQRLRLPSPEKLLNLRPILFVEHQAIEDSQDLLPVGVQTL